MNTPLGQEIEAWRLDEGLTRPALGLVLQVVPDLIYGWERRGVVPSPVNRRKLEKHGFAASTRRDAA